MILIEVNHDEVSVAFDPVELALRTEGRLFPTPLLTSIASRSCSARLMLL